MDFTKYIYFLVPKDNNCGNEELQDWKTPQDHHKGTKECLRILSVSVVRICGCWWFKSILESKNVFVKAPLSIETLKVTGCVPVTYVPDASVEEQIETSFESGEES